MSSIRGRSILFVLVALAIMLLPNAVEAQGNCCTATGFQCSACCWPDQVPRCTQFPDGSWQCWCFDKPAPPCEGLRASSRTLVLNPDQEAELADHQIQYELANGLTRRDGSYVFEDWALVSNEGGTPRVVTGSSAEFRARLQKEAGQLRLDRGKRVGSRLSGLTRASTVLVVQEPEHPHNSRMIMAPRVAPLKFDAGLPRSAAGQEVWFRAEVGKDGVVDQVIFMNIPPSFASTSIHEQIRENMSLIYASEKRHRAVVFGVLRADNTGRLELRRPFVTTPNCCCGGVWCP